MGWGGITNGRLMALAKEKFDVFVTFDCFRTIFGTPVVGSLDYERRYGDGEVSAFELLQPFFAALGKRDRSSSQRCPSARYRARSCHWITLTAMFGLLI